ncbi:MAG TPA: AarF/UbiB family protein [Thermoanaerobaculia bacterium]|jgi:ubiquinone biosynthesis protein|nr:AarF/UbiB family protein [Thermoanaerobaculia bacterium]
MADLHPAVTEAPPPAPVPAVLPAPVEPEPPSSGPIPGFEMLPDRPPHGILRRFLTTQRHLIALALGGLVSHARAGKALGKGRRLRLLFWIQRLIAALVRPFLDKSIVDRPFPVQLRRRLEILGPTYIKLGQVLALRQDILPASITDELKNLLDRLPVVPFDRYLKLIEEDLQRPVSEMYSWIDPIPTGSASIAQIHRATTREGDSVIIKVVKPGIRETLTRDAILLRLLGLILQGLIPQYRPKQLIREFVDYTRREVDLHREADNAETFAANFHDMPDVVFPRIYRRYSASRVLCMEFLNGFKPGAPETQNLTEEERDRLVDLGAASIIRMLYRDGFFHADLHPGNLLILPGPRVGFIDLGMVGRFDSDLRRTFLYYYYTLVMGDAEGAARYLTALAQPGPGADSHGFRREVTEILLRWNRSSSFRDFSLGQLIMRSVNLGATHRLYFPVEMVLMVKALITFEGVGQILKPGLDVAAVSQEHASAIFRDQFSPQYLFKQLLRAGPDVLEAVAKAPSLITEGLRLLEQVARRRPENPLHGLRGTLFGGFCMVAGAILAGAHGPWPVWAILFLVGIVAALHRDRS